MKNLLIMTRLILKCYNKKELLLLPINRIWIDHKTKMLLEIYAQKEQIQSLIYLITSITLEMVQWCLCLNNLMLLEYPNNNNQECQTLMFSLSIKTLEWELLEEHILTAMEIEQSLNNILKSHRTLNPWIIKAKIEKKRWNKMINNREVLI